MSDKKAIGESFMRFMEAEYGVTFIDVTPNRAAEIHDFFQSYSDPNSDESELVATAYRLRLTTADFKAYRMREGEAAQGAF